MSNVALTCLQVLSEMAFTYVAKNYLSQGVSYADQMAKGGANSVQGVYTTLHVFEN